MHSSTTRLCATRHLPTAMRGINVLHACMLLLGWGREAVDTLCCGKTCQLTTVRSARTTDRGLGGECSQVHCSSKTRAVNGTCAHLGRAGPSSAGWCGSPGSWCAACAYTATGTGSARHHSTPAHVVCTRLVSDRRTESEPESQQTQRKHCSHCMTMPCHKSVGQSVACENIHKSKRRGRHALSMHDKIFSGRAPAG